MCVCMLHVYRAAEGPWASASSLPAGRRGFPIPQGGSLGFYGSRQFLGAQAVSASKKITLPPMANLDEGLYDTPASYAAIDIVDCDLFLSSLRTCGIPSIAARTVGRGEVVFRREKSKNPAFSDAWDWAMREAADLMKAEARRRAVDGIDKPVFYQGDECAVIREYSDSLLIALLKADHEDFKQDDDDAATGRNSTPASINVNIIPKGQYAARVEEVPEE